LILLAMNGEDIMISKSRILRSLWLATTKLVSESARKSSGAQQLEQAFN
jgi:hypothetical protein